MLTFDGIIFSVFNVTMVQFHVHSAKFKDLYYL